MVMLLDYLKRNEFWINRFVIALIVTSFSLMSSLTMVKWISLVISLLYFILTTKISLKKEHIILLILTVFVSMSSIFALSPDLILNNIVSNLFLNIILFFLLTHFIIKSSLNFKFMINLILINALLIFSAYLPLIIESNGVFRIREYSYNQFFYYSANFLSFIAVLGHVLWFHKIRNMKHITFNSIVFVQGIHILGHIVWALMGYYTFSRSYYALLAFVIFIGVLNWIFKTFSFKTILGLLIGTIILVFFILGILNHYNIFEYLMNYDLAQVNNQLINRFISLFRLLFTQIEVLDYSTLNRLRLIQVSIVSLQDAPFFGIGLGLFRYIASMGLTYGYYLTNATHTHAEMFEILVSLGSIGYFIFMWFYLSILKRSKKDIVLFSLLLSVLLSSFFFNVYYDKSLWWIFLAIVWSKGVEHEKVN
jgi:hypothetical protein